MESVTGTVGAAQATGARPKFRTIVIGVLAAVAILVAVIVLLQVFVAERLPALTEETLQAAMQRWDEHGPASYDLDLEIGGAQPGIVHVEVRDGVVTSSTRDDRPTPERTWDVWSVPGQFDTLESELGFAENPQREMQAPAGAKLWLRCEFDPDYGFPRRYHRHAVGGAPEIFWRITHFAAIPKGALSE